jgi:hypothetical protein
MSSTSKPHRWVVDAIEEDSASIEVDGGPMINVPRSMLPPRTKEGDVLRVTMEIDEHGTREAMEASRQQVEKGREASRQNDPGGDISL